MSDPTTTEPSVEAETPEAIAAAPAVDTTAAPTLVTAAAPAVDTTAAPAVAPTSIALTLVGAAPTLVTVPPKSARQANIGADELTVAEVEELFAAQYRDANAPNAKAATGGTAVMKENDMDELLRTIGEEAVGQKYAWYPNWAATATHSAKQSSDHLADDGDSRELEQIVRDIEISIATIDDTTVDTRDRVKELSDEVKILQSQITEMEDGFGSISAQNVALTAEVRELRTIIVSMRQHVATLIRQLLRIPALGTVAGAATTPPAPEPPGTA